MNKQELIKKYEHIYESSHRPFMDGGLFSRGEDAGSARCSFEIIEDLKQLDEPQKVKVPPYVADWFEKNKDDLEFNIWKYIKNWNEQPKDGFHIFMNDEQSKPIEMLIRMQDGYEVEEEPKWVVKIEDNGSAYFVDFFDELQPHLVCGLSGEVMRFDSEDKANAIVTLIECGTVEKVQV